MTGRLVRSPAAGVRGLLALAALATALPVPLCHAEARADHAPSASRAKGSGAHRAANASHARSSRGIAKGGEAKPNDSRSEPNASGVTPSGDEPEGEHDERDTALASYQNPLPSALVPKSSHAARWAGLSGAQCWAETTRRKLPLVRFRGAAVGVQTPVRVVGPIGGVRFVTPGAKSPYGILDCRLALAFADLAELLKQHDVVEVRIDNMYRPHAHLPGKKKPSQHSFGLAVDLTRLKLENGQELVVERDFEGAIGEPVCGEGARRELSSEARSLRDLICHVARADLFHHILTPNHDAAHKDHFHLDIARGARSRIIE